MKRRMTKTKEIVAEIYYSDLPTRKAKVDAIVAKGVSRSYAYELLARLEIIYLISCFR